MPAKASLPASTNQIFAVDHGKIGICTRGRHVQCTMRCVLSVLIQSCLRIEAKAEVIFESPV